MAPVIGGAALLDSLNPCAFSILLLTVAFLFSLGRNRHQILAVGGIYILGIFLVYLGIGLGILRALEVLQVPHFMSKVGATLLILFGGLGIIGHFFPSFPVRLKIPESVHAPMARLIDKASFPAALILGGLVGLTEFPCTGGPYLLVLGLLHDHATRLVGLGYLLVYNLIFVSPLIVILLIASREKLLAKVEAWKKDENKNMRLWGGVAALLLGAVMFFV